MEFRDKLWAAVAQTMKDGGFWDTLMAMGPEADRVKQFVGMLDGSVADPLEGMEYDLKKKMPWILPLFPGLESPPFPDPESFSWVPQVEAKWQELLEEATEMRSQFRASAYKRVTEGGTWFQGGLSFLGSLAPDEFFTGSLPVKARELIATLPRYCGLQHPFGDSYYSCMSAGLKIKLHTSSDNLKHRMHLGLKVPEGCGIRVGGEERTWQDGKVLFLDDAYPHEVWNNSDEERMVFIIDFWHRDLTDLEITLLRAALHKWEVRRLLITARNIPAEHHEFLIDLFQKDDESDIEGYWPNKPELLPMVQYG